MTRLATALTLSLISVSVAQAAKYRVVELSLDEKGVNSFSSAINDSGVVAGTASALYNPPIDISLLNFDDENFVNSLTDPDAAQAGNINTADLLTIYNLIEANESNQFFQKLGDTQSFRIDGNNVENIVGFDQFSDTFNGLTQSTTTLVNDINNASIAVGTAEDAYYKVEYQNENNDDLTYVVKDFFTYGYADINGQTITLLPPDTTMGGISDARSINTSLQVAGWGTVDAVDSLTERQENCDNDETRADVPVESCYQSILASSFTSNFTRRGLIWQLDDAGNVLSTKELGILLTPVSGDVERYHSRALAINNNGIAVGVSDDYFRDTTDDREFAAIFNGDEVIGITDHEEYFNSIATDINDNDVVIGYAFKNINGFSRSKFFYHDMNTGETVYPDDFFDSSASVVRGINNAGIIVGEGEVESTSTSTRRKEAFIYDITASEFTNINDLLACDSNYTIVQGNDINNNGEISATAQVYRQRRDVAGVLEVDENGDPLMRNLTLAVKLVPIAGGTIDDCSEVEETFERKGGSLFYLLLPLGLALFVRRRIAR